MDLEGDETSLGICWAAAASFLEWAGRGGGGVGVGTEFLRGGELSPPRGKDQTEIGLLWGRLEARG